MYYSNKHAYGKGTKKKNITMLLWLDEFISLLYRWDAEEQSDLTRKSATEESISIICIAYWRALHWVLLTL